MVYFASAAALPGASVAKMSAYAAAKGGVITLMRAVAAEERTHGVRANALAPQAIRTAENLASMGEDKNYVERETVAAWVLWLCSRVAGPISGQVIRLG
jgi:NAD(P)-dependent dehydrogenase (short-subunit alcohol dehydrogenase family)